ncbi:50S ribosomal protein L11 [Patescibacteria group bacterium]|nr:50S ribosomal protein L11 [Patescibacteria group bacterium]
MAKKELTKIKLQIPAGRATPAPPIGPALGQHGVAIQDFCTQFNDASKDRMGDIVPVIITVYADRTFSFIMKTPPAAELVKKAAGIKSGAKNPLLDKAGKITKAQLEEIAKLKMTDLNTTDLEAAKRTIAGTAKQMGVSIEG